MMKAHTTKSWFKLSDKALFFVVLALLISSFIFYVFLVNKTIMNVVAREKVESSISSLSTSLGEQEFTYITLKNKVTLELAHAKGFKDISPSRFIARNGGGSPLSYNFAQ